jgi:hypothetical protein
MRVIHNRKLTEAEETAGCRDIGGPPVRKGGFWLRPCIAAYFHIAWKAHQHVKRCCNVVKIGLDDGVVNHRVNNLGSMHVARNKNVHLRLCRVEQGFKCVTKRPGLWAPAQATLRNERGAIQCQDRQLMDAPELVGALEREMIIRHDPGCNAAIHSRQVPLHPRVLRASFHILLVGIKGQEVHGAVIEAVPEIRAVGL